MPFFLHKYEIPFLKEFSLKIVFFLSTQYSIKFEKSELNFYNFTWYSLCSGKRNLDVFILGFLTGLPLQQDKRGGGVANGLTCILV